MRLQTLLQVVVERRRVDDADGGATGWRPGVANGAVIYIC